MALIYLYVMHVKHCIYSIALYYFTAAICFLCLLTGRMTNAVMKVYKLHYYVVGHFLFTLLGILSLLQVSKSMLLL